ncbi:MAG TPA: multiheme c-type cytochrome [Kofleriaceae bacterium]|nr:multiheme c-type cytochrome [Kofleriaceae bacterium]
MRVLVIVILVGVAACDGCEEKFSVEELQDPETCKECHPKHYDQWSGSMHAYASDDPVFIAMNKRGQRETNGELGDFCIQCHAPMALKLGKASGSNFDPAALSSSTRGITCYFCHNVESIVADHNNGLAIALDQTMRGGAKNPSDSPAHFSEYDTKMASRTNNSEMCGSCHDVTTSAAVHLERTFAEWKTTVFAIQDPANFLPVTCSTCHMTPTDGVIASGEGLDVKSRELGFHNHTMAAIDIALTPFPRMDEQLMEIQKILKPSIGIKGPRALGAVDARGGICLDPPGILTVRLDSLSPGHHFPSGAAQDRRVWLEVTAYDASDNVLYARGQVPNGADPETQNDASLTCPNGPTTECATFFDKTKKADGSPAHFFWDVATVESNLIKPPITRDPNSSAYDHSSTVTYQVGTLLPQIERIEAKLWVRPLPFGALDELIASGDLDPSVRAALEKPEATMLAAQSTWLKSTKGTGPFAINTNCNPF